MCVKKKKVTESKREQKFCNLPKNSQRDLTDAIRQTRSSDVVVSRCASWSAETHACAAN